MPFRILNPFPVYMGSTGRPAAGGYLRFFESGTDTEKSVYGDPGLTTDNGSTIALKPDGRTEHDIWGDGSYRVRLYASDDTLIAEADNVEVTGGTGAEIPALVDGHFLTNNGALMLWAPIRQLPDPAGQGGKVLGTDGENFIFVEKPADGEAGADADVDGTTTSMRIGTTLLQTGKGQASASNSETANVAITWPVPFTSDDVRVLIQVVDITGVSPHALAAHSVTNITKTGATVNFNIADRHYVDGSKITNNIPFHFWAFGVKA